uniref:Uncharacterized protein n=1 Tax=Mycena chlorophos TaxID=658473 RepID=A0ABQ0M2A5_MYCCL|nr:predicted protein [Mycena chlorophos]
MDGHGQGEFGVRETPNERRRRCGGGALRPENTLVPNLHSQPNVRPPHHQYPVPQLNSLSGERTQPKVHSATSNEGMKEELDEEHALNNSTRNTHSRRQAAFDNHTVLQEDHNREPEYKI